jgi:tetratricopeptide (TPR) repeat protein
MTVTPRKPLFSSDYQFDVLICLGLLLAIFIPYHQVAGHRFVEFDDGIYTFQNTYIIKGLSWDSLCWAITNTEAANWHPLTWISHLVDRELFGPHPGGYLLENVAWHALAACLCYLAFLKTTGSRLFAFTVALIFAVHPVNVENVAWTSERKSLLNAVFWFVAIISYLDFIETRSVRSYGVTAIAHILGLLSKAMSLTLPGTLVLIHLLYLVYHPDRRDSTPQLRQCWKKILLPVLPLLALSAYFAAITLSAQSMAMTAVEEYALSLRIINSLRAFGYYIVMFFHPTKLAIFYPLFQSQLVLRAAIPGIVMLATITVVALLLVRRKPQILIGWCWFLGTMLPVIGLVQVGSQSHADRYLYIPMLGLAFVFPALFEELCSIPIAVRRALVAASLAVLALSLIAATQIQVSYWKDGVALFEHSLEVTGDCTTAAWNLAVAYERTERYQDLVYFAESEMAIATKPESKAKLLCYKASGLYSLKKYELAIAAAQKALDWVPSDGSAFWIIAASNFQLGNFDKASQYLIKTRATEKPVNRTNFVEVEADKYMAALELLLKRTVPPKKGLSPDAAAKSTGSGPQN